MIKCLVLACLLPLMFNLCSPHQDPNLNRDKRGAAIKLVQDSPVGTAPTKQSILRLRTSIFYGLQVFK